MRRISIRFASVLVAFLMASGAQAALIDRGAGFIYDSVLDITWAQDANINGLDKGIDQIAWADSLSIFDPLRNQTWTDWRLPDMDVNADNATVDCSSVSEILCRDNEYGYLFHQNGISQGAPGLFSNLGDWYWSSTKDPGTGQLRLLFNMAAGNQSTGLNPNLDANAFLAMAVMDGDVGIFSVVPIPASVWLFGSALGLLGWMRRKH